MAKAVTVAAAYLLAAASWPVGPAGGG